MQFAYWRWARFLLTREEQSELGFDSESCKSHDTLVVVEFNPEWYEDNRDSVAIDRRVYLCHHNNISEEIRAF